MRYRIVDALVEDQIKQKIAPGYKIYKILKEASTGWLELRPTQIELRKQEWHNPNKFMDPNEMNKKMNLPPNYLVEDTKKKDIMDKIKESFAGFKLLKNNFGDIMIEWQ